MSTHSNSARQYTVSRVELRTGRPYANLIRDNYLYSDAVAEYFGVSPEDVIPTMGATGAIELTRIHVFKQSPTKNPTGATFDPDLIARGLPAETAFVLDMTLPAADLDTRALLGKMYRAPTGGGGTSSSSAPRRRRMGRRS
jgi:hypothetical protein